MKLFNTLTKQKEEFVPLQEGKVSMYVCGPTVYNLIHIGNARPMIVFDTLRRYFEYKGYDVQYVSNFTDVDDKIIKKAIEEGVSAQEISERYIAECKKDMDGMNVKPATTNPQATQEINGMISMIQTLVDKGYAYPAADGTVYFRVKKFKEYGKLSHKNLDDLQSGFRSLKVSGEDQKEDPLDFVLWKPKKEGEPSWPSPWCDGRPGWHIECSVMSKKYLGEEIDIHAGGEDLIFPHHENEIAQSECCNDKIFAKYWMHNAFLNIDNRKMSKSLGNVVNPDDVVNEYGADTLRLYEMFIGDFEKAAPWNTNSIKGCKRFLDRIWALSEKQVEGEGYRPKLEALINRTIKKVGEDIDALKANTAIAQLMILVNALYDEGGATRAEYEVLLQLLNPFVPHMTEELWQQMGHTDTLAYHEWPKYDEAKCVEQTIEIAVQVNGKVKARLNVAANIESADAIAAAKADPAVAEAIAGKTIAKEIYVKGRLVNIAVKG